jgi:DNA-binding NarL/FixJ family response regulator
MANQKNINAYINVNNNMQITCVSDDDIEKYLAQGYRPQTLMVKVPSKKDMPDLTPNEEKILNLFMEGKEAKDISQVMRIDDSSVNRVLSRIRIKFGCRNNIRLALKVQQLLGCPLMP